MQDQYFSKFPLIMYSNTAAVNITERAVIRNFPTKNVNIYYQYDVRNNERPDQLADKVFKDQYMDWIIYLSNGIIDPYYDWFIRDDVFIDFLKKKYGVDSVDNLTRKILHYRNNWYLDQNIISVSQYNSLPDISKYDPRGNLYLSTAKRYYDVVVTGRQITGYKRKQIDEIHQTNKIVRYEISGDAAFKSDEIVDVKFAYSNTTTTTSGMGQVLTSNSSTLTIRHTSGYVDTSPENYTINFSGCYAYGTESKSNCSISSITSLANNIVESENKYWSPVTIYEYEVDKNFQNKTIRLMYSEAAPKISDYLSKTMKQIL